MDTQQSARHWRILDVIQWGTQYLTRHGISHPRLSMELMLSKVLGIRRLDLYLQFDKAMAAQDLEQLKGLIERRLEHVPLQHLLGEWDFYGLPLGVSEHVLIPRPETEILVESLLSCLQKYDRKTATFGLDLGTGSGNIAVVMLTHLAESRCVAIDLSLEAIGQARLNAKRHGVSARIEFRHGSWFDPLTIDSPGPFDWIVSNPPYVAQEHWDTLPEEVRLYEPRMALWGGAGGMDAYCTIIAGATAHLRAGGWLALETGDGQSQAVKALVEGNHEFSLCKTVRDHNGIERVILAQRI